MGTALHVDAAAETDVEPIRALLRAAGLPTEDLDAAPDLRFWVVRDGAQLVGAIGLERYGAAGLLRSLVVDTIHRNRRVGAKLVDALERDAATSGVELLVLLTQTAKPFFERRGYAVIDRGFVPDEVTASAEFRSLCPASATCMAKHLTGFQGASRG